MRCALQPNNAVPIGNVHVHALVLGREQDSIVSNEMASFLQFFQVLLEPMLGRHDVFEQLPLVDDDRRQMTEISEPSRSDFSPSNQESCTAVFCLPSAKVLTLGGSFSVQSGPSFS